MLADLAVQGEPPRLELPAPAGKFAYGVASSLPLMSAGARDAAALNFALAYAHDLAYPAKALAGAFEDLKYRRKPGKAPSQIVPAPLYFRQAAAQHSPALLPSSPPRPSFSPRISVARRPSISGVNISAFALPPSRTTTSRPTSPELEERPRPNGARRASWNAPPGDLLLSPRIRALRTDGDAPIVEDPREGSETVTPQSAFAQYLFSHASTTTPTPREREIDASEAEGRERGRGWAQEIPQAGGASLAQRSVSADSTPTRTPSSVGTARPPRFLFSRGAAANVDPDDEVTPLVLSPVPVARPKPRLIPGDLIMATISTPTSPAPSAPSSPPTANRGRSHTRRPPSPSPTDLDAAPLVDPRGRSKLRGLGAVKRSLSPVRDPSASASRGRHSDVSHERGRKESSSRARSERSETKGRGRPERREDDEELVELAEDSEDEGRGRRERSRSVLRRGRG